MTDLVTTDHSGSTAILTLNRPEKRNALSLIMREHLVAALEASIDDSSCRAIVLTGTGTSFCAGADLSETGGDDAVRNSDERHYRLAILQSISRHIVQSPKPVIAAVNGSASGAGLSFVSACDAVVAYGGAEFCAVFSRVGLLPDAGILWTLPQRVGSSMARRLLMTGERVGATEARAMGLVDEVVADGELLPAAFAMAERYRHSAPLAIGAIRRALARESTSIEDMFQYEAAVQFGLSDSRDSVEARAAFFEKREPNFREC